MAGMLYTRVTPEGARFLVYFCLAVPAAAFAVRLAKLDRTDPFKRYATYDREEMVPEHAVPPVAAAVIEEKTRE